MRSAVRAVPRIASERDQRRLSDRHGVGAHGQRLCHVRTGADTARDDKLNLADHLHLFQRFHRLAQSGQGWYPGMLDEHLLSRRGPALHAVDHDDVGAALDGQLDVVEDARSAYLDVDRDLPVGDLAQLGDLDREIVATGPVGMSARGTLIDALGQRAHRGDSRADLLPQQQAAAARLGALPDHDLYRVGPSQIVGVESVTRRQALIDEGL